MAKMKAPEGCTSCSYDGEVFDVVDGVADVPEEAVAHLFSHGFSLASADEGNTTDKKAQAATNIKKGK